MNRDKAKEFWAGIFLLLGLALIAGLIILFGEVPDLFKPTYHITVEFSDASGLLKGSDVYLAGAVIGKVTTDPRYNPEKQEVEINLKIDKNVQIRQSATYEVGDSGLLGDRFVVVKPKKAGPGEDQSPFVTDGETIQGTEQPGLQDLMTGAQPLIVHANHIATQLDDMITRLNTDVLPSTSTDDLKETIEKLRHMVDNGDAMITNANDLLSQAKTGQGVLGRLINDKSEADNIADFIANLKAHGPIFYSDDFSKGGAEKSDKSGDDGSRRGK